ncbi:MAG: hypothetical protein ACI4TZ_01410 [Christensenellales bacterium]
MKIKKSKTKTKILAGVVASFMILANGGVIFADLTKNTISKIVNASYTPTEVTINNGDFSNPSSGTLPYTPSSWTIQNKTGDITSGVINLGDSFEEKQSGTYKLNFKPDTSVLNDKQVLMINSGDTNSSCGYKSSNISLSKSSYYVVTFKAYTENTTEHTAFATAFLSGDTNDIIKNSTLAINTSDKSNSNWQTYSIFVETDDINAKTLNLELWLGEKDGNGSNGAVFFDDVKVMCYDHNTYTSILKGRDTTKSAVVNYNTNYVADFIDNPSFEDGLNGWTLVDESSSVASNKTITGVYNVGTGYNSTDTGVEENPSNANIYSNKKALLINNIDKGHVGYKSSYFTVEQNRLYKLSFLAKTGEIDGSAVVKLVERNPYTNEFLSDGVTKNPNYYANSTYEAQTFNIDSISTAGYTNDKTDDWKLYTFYIKGSPYLNSELSIEIWLGTDGSDASGYAFFDNFALQQINTADYDSGNSSGTVANLNQATTSTDFNNGTFNNIVLNTATGSAPYTPADWSLVQDNNSGYNGIINTADTSNDKIPPIKAISTSYPNNNVLMIGNTADNYQKYTSNSVSLSANSYYKIQVSTLTYNLVKASAGLRLVCDGNVIGEILNIDATDWTTYSFLIKTGHQSKSVTLELSLGQTAQGTGYAFFDNVVMTADLTEDDFNASTLNSKKVNLASYDFSNVSAEATNGKYTSYDFTATNNANTNLNYMTTGVIDTAKFGESDGCIDSNYPNPGHPQNKNSYVLMIESSQDTYYSYTSNSKTKLTADNYYKIVVMVKTNGVYQNDEDSKVLIAGSKTEYYPCGASISLNGIDAKFSGIDTNGEWKEYTIYVNCTADTEFDVSLALGSENAYTSGVVYFSNVDISSIDQDAYAEGVSALENETRDDILAIGDTDVKTDDEEENTSNGVNFDWLLVPSIITALAVIIAVVGTILRNVKKNKKKKPVIVKSYSKENVKKLNDNYKKSVADINKQVKKLNSTQSELAIEINNLKLNQGDPKKLKELSDKYNANKMKLEKLEKTKKDLQAEHKTKLADIQQEKNADKKGK